MDPLRPRLPPARHRLLHASHCAIAVSLLSSLVMESLWASGIFPFAFDDAASVSRGGTVSRLDSEAASVLDNDFDFERDPLTAVLDMDVDHGTLTLNSDGTFLYVHDGSNTQSDRFRYRAHDGTQFSRRAEVRITITGAPVAPRITGQRNVTTAEDSSIEIELRDLVVNDPDSRFPADFTLQVFDGHDYSVNGASITPTANFNGNLTVPVRVNDGQLNSNVFNLRVWVTAVNDAPTTVGTVADQAAQEGELFELALAGNFADIDAGDSLSFSANGLPGSRSLRLNAVSGRLIGTPVAVDARDDPYSVEIVARDSAGAIATLRFDLTIFARNRADLSLSLAVQPAQPTFPDNPEWNIAIENFGPADLDEGIVRATWFSSEGPLSLDVAETCSVSNNGTSEPEIECNLTSLPAQSMTTLRVQSVHQEPGNSHVIAVVSGEDPKPGNNGASLSLNLAAAFNEGPAQLVPSPASDVAVGDLDGDGYPDLVTVAEETTVFLNTGEREFATPGVSLGEGSGGSLVELLDWNADGALDLVTAGANAQPGRLYLNDGAANFNQFNELPNITGARISTVADLDSDGLNELVFSGVQGTWIAQNDGQGNIRSFLAHQAVGRDVSSGDMDADGFADLLVTDAESRMVYVLMNDGSGERFTTITLEEGSVASVSVRDVDGDGAGDLLLAVDGQDLQVPRSRILRNQLNGQFVEWASIGASAALELLSGDINRDGLEDLVTINASGVHQVYFGNSIGSGVFDLQDEHIAGAGTGLARLVDINLDGSLDLILARHEAGRVDIHLNNGIGRFGFGDIAAPVISLNGEATMAIDVGAPFEDPGATAIDDIDGDLTDAIQIRDSVDTSLVGSYEITYSVSDRAGNQAQLARIVRVEAVTEGGGGGGGTGLGWASVLLLLMVARRSSSYFRNGYGSAGPPRRPRRRW